ncbi:hypothetical protein [Chryseobacterium carnipullorum]|uniref:Uncharacterized protein n=1 Tax=Chryseobacterium carnipullorum TaxID=1124835 RepID=A0A376DPU1_CHRCU|nr:hypothetical protein [Chryseobacterium carnipullorum]STC93499.1 Uncharacterised protein [Chryseobacterium carnipullorum]
MQIKNSLTILTLYVISTIKTYIYTYVLNMQALETKKPPQTMFAAVV